MLKVKDIEEQLKDLNEDARNWASMTPGGYSYIVVNKNGGISLSVQSQEDILEWNYEFAYPLLAPCTLDQVLKGLDHFGIKYE